MTEYEREAQRRYRARHPQLVSEQRKRYRLKIRSECLRVYGGRCYVCGEDNLDLLELDHLEGKGNAHRDELFGYGHMSPGGWMFYLKLKTAGYPPGLGCICSECHDKKHGRTKDRARCAPAMDGGRGENYIDEVPF